MTRQTQLCSSGNVEFDENGEIKCPICGTTYIHYMTSMEYMDEDQIKESVLLMYQCENADVFYIALDGYKGRVSLKAVKELPPGFYQSING